MEPSCPGPTPTPALRTVLAVLFTLCMATAPALAQDAQRSPTPDAVPLQARVVSVARGLEHPWGLALLPDGGMLVTERPGRLRRVGADGRLSEPLAGVPAVYARGQGGLLDVALSPDFTRDRLVYLSFSEPGDGGAGTAVARGRLGERGLEGTQVIWRQQPKVEGRNHWGSRLVFAPDGTLFVTLGDRFSYRPEVQKLSTTIGKVVRINPDGSIPRDNPFAGRDGVLPEIWSYGHRNAQAAAIDPKTGQLWTVEHGARGGDELNHPQPGRNYGWPVITYGIDWETGLILEVGEWVIARACRQWRLWREQGLPPLRIAVNLSPRQFQSRNLAERIRTLIDQPDFLPDYLELEITESMVMQNVDRAIATLEELRGLGVHLAIDDFGTGYSSLAVLKRFPVDCLKVDRSFVRDVPSDPDDVAITHAVIALAHSMGLSVVAEGVETEAQRAFLIECCCEEMQGFLFSKPLPATELARLVLAQAANALAA